MNLNIMTHIDFTRKFDEYKNQQNEEILYFLSGFWSIKPDSNEVFTLVSKYQKERVMSSQDLLMLEIP